MSEASIFVIAAAAARRSGLHKLISEVWPKAAITLASSFSFQRSQQCGAAVWVADLESPAQAAALLRALENGSPVPVVATIDEPQPVWVRGALAAGVNAIIARDSDREDLRLALEAALSGFLLLHPSSAHPLIGPSDLSVGLEDAAFASAEHLTSREREVLRLMSTGLGNKDIAARLGISEHTAKFHASSIMGKLGVSSRTEAVSQGIRRGLILI